MTAAADAVLVRFTARYPCSGQGQATRPLPSYPRLPRVSRRAGHQPPHTPPTSTPGSVIPAHAGIHTAVVGGTAHRAALRTGVGGRFRALALRTGLGLGPKSSLGRRILGTGVGAVHGEIAAAGRGNDGKGGERERRRRWCGADSRSGAGMTGKGAWVLHSARLPRRSAAMTEVGATDLGNRRWCCTRRDCRGGARQ